MSKEKPFHHILKEIHEEVSKHQGVMKQPEKKFAQWDQDFNAWDRRFTKRMTDMEKVLHKQMDQMSRFFE